MDNSIALSLRCDGSVNRTQVDKMYVLIKSVNLKGEEKLYFIGATEIVKRGAEGICDAIKTACINSVENENFEVILRKISFLVTNVASSNIGEKNGLWTLLKKSKQNASENEIVCPLIRLWCAAHSSNLAWKSVSNLVNKVSLLFQKLIGLS